MGDGKRFDQALRALDKLIAEQQRPDYATQSMHPATVALTAPAAPRI